MTPDEIRKLMTANDAYMAASETRKDIDALVQSVKELHMLNPSRVISLFYHQQQIIEYLLAQDSARTGDGR